MAEPPSQDVKLYNIKRSLDNILERGKAPAKIMYLVWGLATLLVFFMLLCGSGSSAIVSFFAAIGAAVLLGGGSFWVLRFYLQKRRQAALEDFNRRFPEGSERRYTAMNLLVSLLETPKDQLKGKVGYDFLKELYLDLGGTELPAQALSSGFGSDGPPLLESSTWKPLGDVMTEMMASLPKGSDFKMPPGAQTTTQTQADGSVVETSTSQEGGNTISKQVITSPDGSSQTVIHSSSTTSISYDELPPELQADYLPKDLPIIDLSKLPKDMKVQTLPDGSILLPYPNEGADYMVFHPTGSQLPEGAIPVPPPLPPPASSSFKPIPVPLSPPGPIQQKPKKKPPKKKKPSGGVELVYDFIPLDLDPPKPEEAAQSWDDSQKELLLDCFCGAHLKVPAELRGKQAKCSKCERTLDVPE